MKKNLLYLIVSVAVIAASCTDFGEERQLTLSDAPQAVISNIVAEEQGDSITFSLAPEEVAAYYAWLVVESVTTDSSLQAERLIKLLETGVASGLINYTEQQSAMIGVGGLTPNTLYQIYAVTSTEDGIVSLVSFATIRTADDGGKPTPQSVAIENSVVTLTFHEPIRLGDGKVFVSYFAKYTVSGSKPLVVDPGFESYNSQDVEIVADNLSVNGNDLSIILPDAHPGAYASITYEAGVVSDLDGNPNFAFINKADTLIDGEPSGGITVQLDYSNWAMYSEFEESNPDTLAAFTTWNSLMISAAPESGVVLGKSVKSVTPVVIFNEDGKTTNINVTTWGVSGGKPAFLLPEEPARGAIVDITIPEGAFEDIYGNFSEALSVEGNYIYSYGYTFSDVIGTYDVAMTSYWDGPLSETGIIIDKAVDSDTLLVKNLLSSGSVIKGVLDPVLGTLTLDDSQVLMEDVDFGESGINSIYFVNADASAPVILNMPEAGRLISPIQWWGYYLLPLDGWYDVFTESTWIRTSTAVVPPANVKAESDVSSIWVFTQGRTL